MVSGAMLGAIAGFFTALIAVGIPLAGFLLRLDRHVRTALRLLTGHEEIEGDGVLPRLKDVEEQSARNRRLLRESEAVPSPGEVEEGYR